MASGSDMGSTDKVWIQDCDLLKLSQRWAYTEDQQIRHNSTGSCLELLDDKASLMLQVCDASNQRQVWKWKKREARKDDF
jgi:hypothetical protein